MSDKITPAPKSGLGWLIASVAVFLAAVTGVAYVWANRAALLPESVPVHFGGTGQADRWVSRDAVLPMLLILPCIMLAFIVLGRVLPMVVSKIKRDEFEQHRGMFERIFFAIVLTLGYTTGVSLLAQTGMLSAGAMVGMLVAGIGTMVACLAGLIVAYRRKPA
jgi:cytochrome c biogenesis factor